MKIQFLRSVKGGILSRCRDNITGLLYYCRRNPLLDSYIEKQTISSNVQYELYYLCVMCNSCNSCVCQY